MVPVLCQFCRGRYFLTGFILLYVMEQLTGNEEKNPSAGEDPAIGLLAVIGMGFHSLVDGAICSITFSIDMVTGLLSPIGMVLHEFPEAVIRLPLHLVSEPESDILPVQNAVRVKYARLFPLRILVLR